MNKNENHETTRPGKLSGWQRLWIVTSVLYLLLIIVAVVINNSFPRERTESELRNYYSTTFYSMDDRGNMAPLPKETRSLKVLADEEHEFVTKERYSFIGQMAMLWVFPCLAVYALGLSINWVYKGFRAKKDNQKDRCRPNECLVSYLTISKFQPSATAVNPLCSQPLARMKDEMKIRKVRFLAFGILSILAPTAAQADAGVPMLALLWPASWIAFIPVVIIEAWIAKRIIGLAWKPALIRSSIANATSTLIGIPLTWGAFLVVELVLSGGGRAFGVDTLPQKLFAAIVQAPWLIPYEEDLDWLVPTAAIVLLVPFFFASVFIETWAFDRKKQLERPLVKLWSWKANW